MLGMEFEAWAILWENSHCCIYCSTSVNHSLSSSWFGKLPQATELFPSILSAATNISKLPFRAYESVRDHQ